MKLSFASIAVILVLTAAPISSEPRDDPQRHLRRLDEFQNKWYGPARSCSDDDKNDVKIILKTDNYPEESTMWVTDDSNGDAVMKMWGFGDKLTDHTISRELCEGWYTMHLKDTFGDGVCCGYGDGKYEVFVGDDKVEEGGEFESKQEDARFYVEKKVTMRAVNFEGWDGKKCNTKRGNWKDYWINPKIDNMRDCMAEACRLKKWQGYDFNDDRKECKLLLTDSVTYKETQGEACFMKTWIKP